MEWYLAVPNFSEWAGPHHWQPSWYAYQLTGTEDQAHATYKRLYNEEVERAAGSAHWRHEPDESESSDDCDSDERAARSANPLERRARRLRRLERRRVRLGFYLDDYFQGVGPVEDVPVEVLREVGPTRIEPDN